MYICVGVFDCVCVSVFVWVCVCVFVCLSVSCCEVFRVFVILLFKEYVLFARASVHNTHTPSSQYILVRFLYSFI